MPALELRLAIEVAGRTGEDLSDPRCPACRGPDPDGARVAHLDAVTIFRVGRDISRTSCFRACPLLAGGLEGRSRNLVTARVGANAVLFALRAPPQSGPPAEAGLAEHGRTRGWHLSC